jgi:hypothetical protein
MTKDEMIKWAGFEGGSTEQLDKLIWIAQTYAKVSVWREIQASAGLNADCYQISSYPSFKNGICQ